MKVMITFSSLVILSIFVLFTPFLRATGTVEADEAVIVSCADPTAEHRARCLELETQILSATVRIEFQTWMVASNETGYEILNAVGHATVKDGRYLVTHNHTEIPLSIDPLAGEDEVFTRVFMYTAAGELVHEGPLTDFAIIFEDDETVILAHHETGFMTALGFASANFSSWQDGTPEIGTEVAQVDWDGERTRVDWITVTDVTTQSGVPQIELVGGAKKGASGGGIFWQGRHIANNWSVERGLDSQGNVVVEKTTAALNSTGITFLQTTGRHPSTST